MSVRPIPCSARAARARRARALTIALLSVCAIAASAAIAAGAAMAATLPPLPAGVLPAIPDGLDVAVGAPVTSNMGQVPGEPLSSTDDGNGTTRYCPSSPGIHQVTIDLGKAVDVTGTGVTFSGEEGLDSSFYSVSTGLTAPMQTPFPNQPPPLTNTIVQGPLYLFAGTTANATATVSARYVTLTWQVPREQNICVNEFRVFSADDASAPQLQLGADLSGYPSDTGTYTLNSTTTPLLAILGDGGVNYARLDLLVNPASCGTTCPDLANDLTTATALAAQGLKIDLDIEYSDSPTSSTAQSTPAAWSADNLSQLTSQVQSYTQSVIAAFASNGTPVSQVSLGNDITQGLLWPTGQLTFGGSSDTASWSALTQLLTAASQGASAGNPAGNPLSIELDVDAGADNATSVDFFNHMVAASVPFNVIGESYSPWLQGYIGDLESNISNLTSLYNLPVVLDYSQYPYANITGFGTYSTAVAYPDTIPGYLVSAAGQASFERDLVSFMASLPNRLGLGVIYNAPDTKGSLGWFSSAGAAEPAVYSFRVGSGAAVDGPAAAQQSGPVATASSAVRAQAVAALTAHADTTQARATRAPASTGAAAEANPTTSAQTSLAPADPARLPAAAADLGFTSATASTLTHQQVNAAVQAAATPPPDGATSGPLPAMPIGLDVAIGAAVSANDTSLPQAPLTNIDDGDGTSRWCASTLGVHTVTINLGQVENVTGTGITFTGENPNDGATYTVSAGLTPAGETPFPNQAAGNSNPISEGEMYLYAGTTANNIATVPAQYVTLTYSVPREENICVDELRVFAPATSQQQQNLLLGGDISTLIDDTGTYTNLQGTAQPILTIFKNGGFDYGRLRLWINPGGNGNPNLANDLIMGKEIYNAGMGLEIDIHYSDTWADPQHQTVPGSWTGETLAQLDQSMYNYTEQVVQAFAAQGTPLSMVAIGNEITQGMLWAYTTGANPSTTTSAAAIAGATTLSVSSTTGFSVGEKVAIGSGSTQEQATVSAIGSSPNSLTFSTALLFAHANRSAIAGITPAGVTTLNVANTAGITAGDTLYIDSLATSTPFPPGEWDPSTEVATVAQVNSPTQLTLTTPTQFAHIGAFTVQDVQDSGHLLFNDNTGLADWTSFTQLVKEGAEGAMAGNPPGNKMLIQLHIDRGGDNATSEDFVNHMLSAGVPFDVIGESYYAWYHGPMSAMEQNLLDLANKYHKYVMIAEDQYPSVSNDPGYGTYNSADANYPDTQPGYLVNAAGQLAWERDLDSFVASIPNGLGLGVLYWDSDAGADLGEFSSGRAAEPVVDDDMIGGTAVMSNPQTSFTVGEPGTFTVVGNGQPTPSISESGALPSGVTFVDNQNGTATLAGTPAAGTVGTYAFTITASNGLVPATQSFTLTVAQQTPTVTVTGSPNPSVTGQPVTYTATVTGVGATPTGSVTVSDGKGASCTINALTAGVGSCSIVENSAASSTSPVVDTITASYGGDGNFTPASGTASQTVNPATVAPSGTVASTLSLSLSSVTPAFGTFAAGVAQTYTSSTSATVTSSAGQSTLSAQDPSSTFTGHLVNGSYEMVQPLLVDATDTANPTGTFAPVGGSANPTTVLTYDAPVSNDAVTIGFEQMIAATDPLRTGTYSKTITFTLSTNTP